MNMRDRVVWLVFAAILLACGGVWAKEPPLSPLDVQDKVDAAFARGGGEVRIGPGDYEAKPFVLKSGITLNLLEGATVYASTNVADYAAARGERCFIFADGATNVSIVGKGTLNGRGWAFRESRGLPGESQPQDLPVMIRLSRCRDVRLADFTYRDCGAWGCHLRNCDGVVVRRVKCVSHVNNTNDGIDVESSNVLIEDCDIDSDDDAIVFKTESDLSFQVTNVVVRNCRLASCCNALKFGTGSYCDFRDITVEDCVFSRAKYNYRFEWFKLAPGVTNAICGIAGMALEVVDGGRMENVVVRNVDVEGYQTPIFIREERRHEPQPGKETYLRNVLIENVRGFADSRIACSITGTPGRRPSNITLRNVDLTFPGGGTEEDVVRPVPELEKEYPDSCMFEFKPLPAFGFYLRHADDVTFENVRLRTLTPDARKPIVTEDCRGFRESAESVRGNVASTPSTRFRELKKDAYDWWKRVHCEHLSVIAANASETFDLVFIGDSITHFWHFPGEALSRGDEEYAELEREFSVLNLGIAGDRTQNLLWRLENGELDGYAAKVVMLTIGTNNRMNEGETAGQTAEAIGRILSLIRTKQPQAKVLLLPIFPCGADASDAGRQANGRVNGLIRAFADGTNVIWTDFTDRFLEKDGRIREGVLQKDLLHPDALGYRIWREAVTPLFRRYVGKGKIPFVRDARSRWNAENGYFEPNTDESKVAPYVLEDPLTFANGAKLRSAADWPKRRAEILDVFARKIYGEEPPLPTVLSWDLLEEKEGAIAGYAKRRVYRMHFTADKSGPAVDWGLWLPRHAKGRVPVVLFLNYRGIQEIDGDKSIPLCRGWSRRRPSLGVPEHLATERTRGVLQNADNPSHLPIQTILARGYAILSASYTDVSPDPDPFGADGVDQYAFATTNGVFTLWGTRNESRADNITSIGAWAWALSRGLDLALAQPEIDPRRTIVTGCSRLGKAAFLAAARDERFAVCVPNQCGGGGVCLAKRDFGENVSTENAMFTHWYCKAYRRYAANPAVLMDFDMHLLLAAIAPRRVLVEGFGPNDWMDTKAEYLAAVAASPVWEFLGVPGLPKTGFPDYYDESAIGPYLGYVRRTEGHGISGYDWNWMLGFADAVWKNPYQETVALSNGFGRAVLSLEGGRLLSWTDADGREVLFMPENKVTPNGDWSHGGIPLCWPWFGRKDGVIHGFIRNKHMSVRRRTANSVTVGYSLAAGEEKSFPYAADLELVLTLDEKLTLSLRTKNVGEESFLYTAGFHPYFKVGTYRQVRFTDVDERPFTCVDGMDRGFERRPDGIFSFVDASLNRCVSAQACGNSHVIVWTPGSVEPANRNLKPDETEEFLGYGPAVTKAAGPISVKPGEEKFLTFTIGTSRADEQNE